ncbi:MAG: F0F1 ATP synthase subunit B' [Hyphomicrobiaceae bacterium]
MPQLNPADFAPQLIWLAIIFIGLYFLLSRVALPRIGEVIEERRDRIQRDLDEAERLKTETEKAIASYEQALAEARGRAHNIAQETREKLSAEVARERTDVDKNIAEQTAAAEERIAIAKSAALSQVNEIAVETTETIVNELIGATTTGDEVAAAVSHASANT